MPSKFVRLKPEIPAQDAHNQRRAKGFGFWAWVSRSFGFRTCSGFYGLKLRVLFRAPFRVQCCVPFRVPLCVPFRAPFRVQCCAPFRVPFRFSSMFRSVLPSVFRSVFRSGPMRSVPLRSVLIWPRAHHSACPSRDRNPKLKLLGQSHVMRDRLGQDLIQPRARKCVAEASGSFNTKAWLARPTTSRLMFLDVGRFG